MSFDFPQLGQPYPQVYSAGQPTPAQFEAAQRAGLSAVINLRPPEEDPGFDQAALMARLALPYTVIPVASAEDLNLANVRALDAAMAAHSGKPLLIHCASANRVGALLALRAAWLHGASAEEALRIGQAGGLTRMAPVVAGLLERGAR